MPTIVNGTTYYLFKAALVVNSTGDPQENVPVTVKDLNGAAITVLDAVSRLVVAAPATNAYGATGNWLAPTMGPLLYAAGSVSLAVESADVAAAVTDLQATVAGLGGAAVADLTNRVGALETGAGITRTKLDQLGSNVAGANADLSARLAAIDQAILDLRNQTPPVPAVTRLSWARLQFALPDTSGPGDYSTIPGYRAGKVLIGCNNGTHTIEQFDSLLYSSTGTGTPTARCATVREYMLGPLFNDSEWARTRAWMIAGRVPMLSWKKGPWSVDQIASGAADADIRAQAQRFKATAGTAWVSFWHEPEEFSTAAAADTYRRAYRRHVTIFRGEGVTNVAWSAPMFVMIQDATYKDYKLWHPEWDGTDWHRDVTGTRLKWVDLFGIDYYDPHVNTTTQPIDGVGAGGPGTEYNHTWQADMTDVILRKYRLDGGRPMPVIIGELGLYTTYVPVDSGVEALSLKSTGITVALVMSDMIDTGVFNASYPLAGVCFWNVKLADFHNINDYRAAGQTFGEKTRALRNVVAGQVLRTTSASPRSAGQRVVPSDPETQRQWVARTGGNAVYSAAV